MEVLVIGIINRNKLMLEKQGELSEKVQREMQHTSEIQLDIIEDLAAVVETRDCETGEHIARTKQYVNMIMRFLIPCRVNCCRCHDRPHPPSRQQQASMRPQKKSKN